jgi:hypothetical protein
VCPPGYAFDENGNCVPCPKELGFVVDSQGRCVCDSSRGLVLDVIAGRCVCPPGQELNEQGICVDSKCLFFCIYLLRISFNFLPVIVPECRVDPDCHTTKYCEASNLTCADPCIRDPCGANAFGTPFNHICNCQCIEGFTGNPRTGCGTSFLKLKLILIAVSMIKIVMFCSTNSETTTTKNRFSKTRHPCQLSG